MSRLSVDHGERGNVRDIMISMDLVTMPERLFNINS